MPEKSAHAEGGGREFEQYLAGEEVSPPDVEDDFPHYEAYAERLIEEITSKLDSPNNNLQEIPPSIFENADALAKLINRLEIIADFHGIDYTEIEEEVESLREYVTLDRATASLTTWEEEAVVRIDYNGSSVELQGMDVNEFNVAIQKLKEANGAESLTQKSSPGDERLYADEMDGIETILADRTLPPDTQKFRVASCLVRQRNPVTAEELADLMEGTSWSKDQKSLGRTMSRLFDEGYAGRRRRQRESRGQNPYEYMITRMGDAVVRQSEEKAAKLDETTWEDVKEGS